MPHWAGGSDSSARIVSALFEKPFPSVSWRLLQSVWLHSGTNWAKCDWIQQSPQGKLGLNIWV